MNTNTPMLPMLFREALSSAGMSAVDDWWTGLNAAARYEALQLWHECGHEESGLTVRVEARFADDRNGESGDFWHSDYYDYLVNHEVYFFDVPGVHICTRHPTAAEAARNGVIPHDFVCPFSSENCPMQRLLANSPGRTLRLRVSVVAARRMPPEKLTL